MDDTLDLLAFYRRVMDAIHAGGNIYNDKGRMKAYVIIAEKASQERKQWEASGGKGKGC